MCVRVTVHLSLESGGAVASFEGFGVALSATREVGGRGVVGDDLRGGKGG